MFLSSIKTRKYGSIKKVYDLTELFFIIYVILTTPEQEMLASNFHGKDGLGDVFTEDPKDTSPLQTEHAVSAINRLAKEHKNELTVIATGPLTNLALALR